MISIVMGYYNRIKQLDFTLNTISKSNFKDFEIIIVDDYSEDIQNPKLLLGKYKNLNIKIIYMKELNSRKTYFNPCIVYNTGFRHTKGEKILIQNPECCHMGDVLSYVDKHLDDNNYLSFHCFAISKIGLPFLYRGEKIETEGPNVPPKSKWYNHKEFNPRSLHFTTAITKKNLVELNGFDERFALGKDYDDNEFIARVKNKGLNVTFVDHPYTIHQYHGKSFNNPLNPIPINDNSIFFEETIKNKIIKAANKENII